MADRESCILLTRALMGLWLGLWTISGIATCASGLFILAMQLYGLWHFGSWFDLTPAGILQGFNIESPTIPWEFAEDAMDCVLRLPLSAVFIWCGLHVAGMAWIARKNMETKASIYREVLPLTHERFKALGISRLEVRKQR